MRCIVPSCCDWAVCEVATHLHCMHGGTYGNDASREFRGPPFAITRFATCVCVARGVPDRLKLGSLAGPADIVLEQLQGRSRPPMNRLASARLQTEKKQVEASMNSAVPRKQRLTSKHILKLTGPGRVRSWFTRRARRRRCGRACSSKRVWCRARLRAYRVAP